MNFQQAFETCFRKYADFGGRASRSEFWWFFLAQLLICFYAYSEDRVAFTVASTLLLLPDLSVGARRLHDVGRSGWWQLIVCVPLILFRSRTTSDAVTLVYAISFLIMAVFWVWPGQAKSNAFGPPPVHRSPRSSDPPSVA